MKITGLNKLDKVIQKLDNIESFIGLQTDLIIAKDKKQLEDYNRLQLNAAGIGSDGQELEYMGERKTPLDGPYTKPYSRYKNSIGGQTGHIDLRLSGDFQKSIKLFRIGEGEWEFTSEDIKFEWLKSWYGENILGVTEEFLQEFSDDTLQPQLQTKVDKYIQ
jgi:hypothetical protein